VNELELHGIYLPPLNGAEATLRAGLYVVLGAQADGTAALIRLLGGLARPRRGSVRFDGQDPSRTPAIRRRIGVLLDDEDLPPAPNLGKSIEIALGARKQSARADAILGPLGLGSWAARRLDSLTPGERRSVALALALGLTGPACFALHEPLATSVAVDRAIVRRLVAERAGAGSIVVCTTASPADASELGGVVLLLDRGRLARTMGVPLATELAPGTPPDLSIRTNDARRLAAELAGAPAVSAVHWDDRIAPGQLRVRGSDFAALALAVMGAAVRAGVEIQAIVPSRPALALARAASDGIARAAYDAAQRAAYEASQRGPAPNLTGSWTAS
jgi:ABC-2 type transport system ATP-binding protein